MELEKLAADCKKIANEHGFVVTRENLPTYLMLIVSEAAEAMESFRDGDFENVGVELADIVIRTLHAMEDLDFDVSAVVARKMLKNMGRPYKHGRKTI